MKRVRILIIILAKFIKIKSDKKWMESIKIKAKKRDVSVDKMVEIDAKYTLNKNS